MQPNLHDCLSNSVNTYRCVLKLEEDIIIHLYVTYNNSFSHFVNCLVDCIYLISNTYPNNLRNPSI